MTNPCSRRVHAAVVETVAAVFVTALQISPASGQTMSLGTQSRDLVFNATAIKPLIDAAVTRRVDFAGIGDSNMAGFDHGFAKAWSDRYGWYASSLMGMNHDGGWDAPGYFDRGAAPYGAANSGAPEELHRYRLWYSHLNNGYNNFPPSYAYYPDGTHDATDHWQPTAVLSVDSPLWGRDLTWHITHATFATGNGAFTPDATIAGSYAPRIPWNRIYTNTGVVGLTDTQVAIPASAFASPGAQSLNLAIAPHLPPDHDVTGPFLGLWQRVESNLPTGVSFTTMLWQGGGTARDAAAALQSQTDDAIKEFLRNQVRLQNGAPLLLIQIHQGGNDMGGNSAPSLGPNPAPSWNPEGFADNVEAIIQRIRPLWISSGYDPSNLMFQTGTIHPLSGDFLPGKTRIQRMAEQEQAVITLSKEHPEYNIAVIRGTKVSSPLSFEARGWYDPPSPAHLTTNGYIGFSELIVRQVEAYTHSELQADRSIVTSLSFTFDQDLTTVTPDMLDLHNLTGDFDVPSDDLAVDYDPETRTAVWTFGGLPFGELKAGDYEATVTVPGSAPAAFNFSAMAIASVPGLWRGGNGNWSDASCWGAALIPDNAAQDVMLDRGSAAVSTVTLDQNATIRTLLLQDDDKLNIDTGHTLTLAASGSVISGIVNVSGALVAPGITVNGRGQLNYLGSGDHQAGDVTLLERAKLTLSAGADKTLKLASVTIDVAGGAKLDVKDNRLIIQSPIGSWTGTAYSGVSGLVAAGLGDGTWNGNGIITSMTDATSGDGLTMLGVATAAETRGISANQTDTWCGQAVTGSDTLVMYTYGGDANLSGFVDVDDYGQIDFNASTGGILTGWFNGDFDYNGFQDVDDYGIIDFAMNIQGPPFVTAGGLNVSVVPEPAWAGAWALSAWVLRRVRRR